MKTLLKLKEQTIKITLSSNLVFFQNNYQDKYLTIKSKTTITMEKSIKNQKAALIQLHGLWQTLILEKFQSIVQLKMHNYKAKICLVLEDIHLNFFML